MTILTGGSRIASSGPAVMPEMRPDHRHRSPDTGVDKAAVAALAVTGDDRRLVRRVSRRTVAWPRADAIVQPQQRIEPEARRMAAAGRGRNGRSRPCRNLSHVTCVVIERDSSRIARRIALRVPSSSSDMAMARSAVTAAKRRSTSCRSLPDGLLMRAAETPFIMTPAGRSRQPNHRLGNSEKRRQRRHDQMPFDEERATPAYSRANRHIGRRRCYADGRGGSTDPNPPMPDQPPAAAQAGREQSRRRTASKSFSPNHASDSRSS